MPEDDVPSGAGEFHRCDFPERGIAGEGIGFHTVRTHGAVCSVGVWVHNVMGARPDREAAGMWRDLVYNDHRRQIRRGVVCVRAQPTLRSWRRRKHAVDTTYSFRSLNGFAEKQRYHFPHSRMVTDLPKQKGLGADYVARTHLPGVPLNLPDPYVILLCPFFLWRSGPGLRIVPAEQVARHVLPNVIDDAFEGLVVIQKATLHEEAVLLKKCDLIVAECRLSVCKVRVREYLRFGNDHVFGYFRGFGTLCVVVHRVSCSAIEIENC